MARQKRLNLPGAIYHVITRGLNGIPVFKGKYHRIEFLRRLARALEKTACRCYGWALMANHVHLLVRTSENSLTEFMRKTLTGYAIYFNRRHKRRGYLYQNRYKSILCQEDAYLLELIRYIHLNPVRAGLIKTINELDQYPWTGHGTLIGRNLHTFQSVTEILPLFGTNKTKAVNAYRAFIEDGWDMGKREDLMGRGLKRNELGWSVPSESNLTLDFWRGEERILGDEAFIHTVLKCAEEVMLKREKLKRAGWNLERLAKKVRNHEHYS